MVDELDEKIIKFLQQNGRISYKELGDLYNVTSQTISDRVSKMVEKNVIERFTALTNQEKLGSPMSFVVEIDLEITKMKEIQEKLMEFPELHLIYVTTGQHDIVALGIARDISHLYEIIEEKISHINGVKTTQTSIALRIVKEDVKKCV
jgi:Lrp/AsnC family transcriptional regulator for asnA, asnC and gidA